MVTHQQPYQMGFIFRPEIGMCILFLLAIYPEGNPDFSDFSGCNITTLGVLSL